jgi:rhamnulokinase
VLYPRGTNWSGNDLVDREKTANICGWQNMTAARVAVDLGAESGRVIVGTLASGRLEMQEVHRFLHEPLCLPTGLHWDITGIWREILIGLRSAAAWCGERSSELRSIGVDGWGVDWAMVDAAGELIGLPHAYRDPRNEAAFKEVVGRLGCGRIYDATGVQLMAINTLYSLYAHRCASPQALAAAERLLFLPDLIHFWLSGERINEATITSTSQIVEWRTRDWSRGLLVDLGLPTAILGPIVAPGTLLGPLRADVASSIELEANKANQVRVIAPASHDTASAVAAVPAEAGSNWCFISSGTWSLLGAELDEPCVTEAAQAAMFTNELGTGGRTRFLKNIPGLWLVQLIRREFARRGQEFDYRELAREASVAPALRTLIDPADAELQMPGGILQAITAMAGKTGQLTPASAGEFVRCCLESLTLTYREKLADLESILGRRFDVIHVVGGGGKNALSAQMTADATGRSVVVGPFEATAAGNILVQAMADGQVADMDELRQIVARSTELATYEPRDSAAWAAASERFRANAARG